MLKDWLPSWHDLTGQPMLDESFLSPRLFWDAAQAVSAPLIATHRCAAASRLSAAKNAVTAAEAH